MHRRPSIAPSTLAALLLALLLAACGSAPSPQATGLDRSDPAAVNAAWVAAVQQSDRAAVLSLLDAGSAQASAFNAGQYLGAMARHISPTDGKPDSAGAFLRAEPLDVRAAGAGHRAYSRWVFEKRTRCYYAELAELGGSGRSPAGTALIPVGVTQLRRFTASGSHAHAVAESLFKALQCGFRFSTA